MHFIDINSIFRKMLDDISNKFLLDGSCHISLNIERPAFHIPQRIFVDSSRQNTVCLDKHTEFKPRARNTCILKFFISRKEVNRLMFIMPCNNKVVSNLKSGSLSYLIYYTVSGNTNWLTTTAVKQKQKCACIWIKRCEKHIPIPILTDKCEKNTKIRPKFAINVTSSNFTRHRPLPLVHNYT